MVWTIVRIIGEAGERSRAGGPPPPPAELLANGLDDRPNNRGSRGKGAAREAREVPPPADLLANGLDDRPNNREDWAGGNGLWTAVLVLPRAPAADATANPALLTCLSCSPGILRLHLALDGAGRAAHAPHRECCHGKIWSCFAGRARLLRCFPGAPASAGPDRHQPPRQRDEHRPPKRRAGVMPTSGATTG